MERLYSEYQVDLSMEEKAMWEQKPEEEKKKPFISDTALKRKEKKGNKAAAPTVAMAKRG
jgi:hypothetical protein